jgi:hypothetical protein
MREVPLEPRKRILVNLAACELVYGILQDLVKEIETENANISNLILLVESRLQDVKSQLFPKDVVEIQLIEDTKGRIIDTVKVIKPAGVEPKELLEEPDLRTGWIERGEFYEMTLTNGEVGSDLSKFTVKLQNQSCRRNFAPTPTGI